MKKFLMKLMKFLRKKTFLLTILLPASILVLLLGVSVFVHSIALSTPKQPIDTSSGEPSFNTAPNLTAKPDSMSTVQAQGSQSSQNKSVSTYSCTTTTIPYGKTYMERDYLASGQIEIFTQGEDGSKQVCPPVGSYKGSTITTPPVDEVIIVGTGLTAAQKQAALDQQNQLDAQQKIVDEQNERQQKLQSCLSSARAQGANEVDAEYFCSQAIQ